MPTTDALVASLVATARDLPRLNAAVQSRRMTAHALEQRIRVALEPVTAALAGLVAGDAALGPDEAAELLKLYGFCVSTVERHHQAARGEPGEALLRLRGVGALMMRLGEIAGLPPRDSHYTYWLLNDGDDPLTFTGSREEVFFLKAVVETERRHQDSNSALRPICSGALTLTSDAAAAAIERAAANHKALTEWFRSFSRGAPQNMTPAFFMKEMRSYLVSYPIEGRRWTGVNAANLAAQVQQDYLAGTVEPTFYEPIVGRRSDYISRADRAALERDRVLPSLADRFFEALLAEPGTPLIARTPLASYNDLFKWIKSLSGAHWSLIMNYLVKPSEALTQAERADLPVSPDAGTGHASHGQTEKIMRMRRVHPVRGVIANRLSEPYAGVALMFHFEGLTLADIATLKGLSGEGAARIHAEAMDQLRREHTAGRLRLLPEDLRASFDEVDQRWASPERHARLGGSAAKTGTEE